MPWQNYITVDDGHILRMRELQITLNSKRGKFCEVLRCNRVEPSEKGGQYSPVINIVASAFFHNM